MRNSYWVISKNYIKAVLLAKVNITIDNKITFITKISLCKQSHTTTSNKVVDSKNHETYRFVHTHTTHEHVAINSNYTQLIRNSPIFS